MKRHTLFNIPVVYMLLYTVLILLIGIWLFLLGQGMGENSTLFETLDAVVVAAAPKSLHQVIEIATPHLFAIGVMVFVSAHFLLFGTRFSQRRSIRISIALLIAALFDILIYLFISIGWVVSGWIKLVALVLFISLFLLLLGMVALSL